MRRAWWRVGERGLRGGSGRGAQRPGLSGGRRGERGWRSGSSGFLGGRKRRRGLWGGTKVLSRPQAAQGGCYGFGRGHSVPVFAADRDPFSTRVLLSPLLAVRAASAGGCPPPLLHRQCLGGGGGERARLCVCVCVRAPLRGSRFCTDGWDLKFSLPPGSCHGDGSSPLALPPAPGAAPVARVP